MPIKIQSDLPARSVLEKENIFVMTEQRASKQDIRPLKIAIVNLMPTKVATETQLLRLLGNTPLQVEISLVHMENHISRNTGTDHMEKFYITSKDALKSRFDGMIITGAPVEQMAFEKVDYWEDLCRIMDFAKKNVFSTLYICWGAQAGLYYHYGIKKYPLDAKLFGVFEHTVDRRSSMLFRGFDDKFYVPHSRHTTVRLEDVEACPELKILSTSPVAGLYACATDRGRQIFITGHSEYDAGTLKAEYLRDKNAGLPIDIPVNYFPDDDDTLEPIVTWRSCANLLYSNWLNYFVYQTTPYDREKIK